MNPQEGSSFSRKFSKIRTSSLWRALILPNPPSLQIFVLIIIGVLLPLLFVLILSYKEVNRHLTLIVLERRAALVQLAEASVTEKLDRFVLLGHSFATQPTVVDYVKRGEWDNAIDLYLSESIEYFPEVDRLLLVNPEGVLMSDWPHVPEVKGQSFAYRDWYRGVSTTQKAYVSEVYLRAAAPQVNVIAFALPLTELNADQTLLGYLVLQVRIEEVFIWKEKIDLGTGGFIYIVDQRGHIVTHPAYTPQGKIVDYSSLELVQKLKNGQNGEEISFNSIEQVEQLSAFEPISEYGWGVVVVQTTKDAFASRGNILRDLQLFLVGVILVALVFSIMLIWLFARMRSFAFKTAQQMNESLHEHQIQLNEAEHLARLGSWKWDVVNNKITCTDELYELFGMRVQPISYLVQFFSSIAVDDDRSKMREVFEKTIKKGSGSLIFRIKRINDSQIRWVHWLGRVKSGPDGKPLELTGIVQDITQERELDEVKSQFVVLAAHQLRTPLSIISWFSEMLLSDKELSLKPRQRSYVRDIFLSNKRLIKLVNMLLDVSRIEMGTLHLREKEISISEICNSILVDFKWQIKEKKSLVKVKLGRGLRTIWGDENLMSIVLSNLISNAINYSPEKGKIFVDIKKESTHLLISVKDTGYGIPQEAKEKIFSKFFRANNAKRIKPDGTGLGLYMVKALVEEKSNGKVWFESEEGKGSTFFVSIPLSKRP